MQELTKPAEAEERKGLGLQRIGKSRHLEAKDILGRPLRFPVKNMQQIGWFPRQGSDSCGNDRDTEDKAESVGLE